MSKKSASACHQAHFWVLLGGVPLWHMVPITQQMLLFRRSFFKIYFQLYFLKPKGFHCNGQMWLICCI